MNDVIVGNVCSLCAMVTPTSTTTVSLRLKRILTMPTRLASGLAPIEQTIAVVTQSPRYMPTMTAYMPLKLSMPVAENACRMPTVADELCSANATPAPVT